MKKQLGEIIDDLHGHLEYQKMMGVKEVPKSPTPPPSPLEGEGKGEGATRNQLNSIRSEIGDCKRCKLCKERKNIVFGVGNPDAQLMFIGEGPGADEDEQGIPFVGRAGQLLTKIIQAMGLKRDDVYIGNIAKCRPPNNRNPEPDEIETCMPFLLKQVSVIKPKIVVALGAIAAKSLLNVETPISKIRGKAIDWEPKNINWSCKLIPTYHPAFLLRNPNMKRPVWEDMQKVMELMG
jgi:DNA polymerase